jgi:hypothetical protein
LLAQSRNHRFCVIAPSVAERSVARGGRSCYVIDTSLHNLVFYVIVNSARLILITLIFAVPTILLIDGPIVQGLVVAVLSVGTTIAAVSLRQGEAGFLLPVIRPIVGLAMIPAVWMLFQIVPLDNTGLAHPIWQSAEQALGSRIGGSISVNPGATLVALGQYLSMLAVTLLAAAVAVDRQRAEWVLFALVAAAALVAVVMIGHGVMHFTFLDEDRGSTGRAQARDCVALGLIASTAAAIRTFERRETAHLHPERSATTLLQTFAVCLAVMLCGIALALDLSGTLLFVVTYGLGMLLAVVVIRRMRLGIWGGTAIAVTALLVAIAIIGGQSAVRHTDFTLAFALQQPAALISTTQRILADAPWTGTGAGTFASLLPIYIDAGDIVADAVAPTAASNAAITLGRPMFWMIVVTVMFGIFVLLRGALNRGRDSFHPAAGASSLLLLLLFSFCDNGILGMPVGICAAGMIGLAFAQCTSRTTAQMGDAELRSGWHRHGNGRHK